MIKKGWKRMAAAASAVVAIALVYGRSKRRRRAQRVVHAPEPVFQEFDRLAQELGHEIRNPLTAICARLYTLHRKLPAGSVESQEAATIAEEIRHLNRILEDFRQRGAPSPPKLLAVSGPLLLTQVRDLFAAEFDPQRIALRCETKHEFEVMADPHLLKQVLINLVKNAAESILQEARSGRTQGRNAPRPRGSITLRAWCRKASLQGRMGDEAVFEVEDNGPGVREEVRTRLLEPFFSTKPRGTGLGLPIAARIVAQHGGELEFDSEPGRGATFRVLLPLRSHGP